jgi:hypothetical protein
VAMNNLRIQIKRNLLWIFYVIFVLCACVFHDGEPTIIGTSNWWLGKLLVWIILLCFLGYSLNISRQENFFKSLQRMSEILWSRQVGLDLYIGLLIPLTLIYLHEGSLLVLAFWVVPILIFANLATLVYLGLNFEALLKYFI